MAFPDLDLTVPVEKAIHEQLQNLLQEIWDKHKVCVNELRPNWFDVSDMGESKMLLTGLELKTTTKT
jgi:hypothetical protein